MTEAPAPDDSLPARLSAGTVLGVAMALLLAMLPGLGFHGARPFSAIGAAHADQPLLAAANRLGEAAADLSKVRGPKVRAAFGDAPVLPAAALALAFFLLAAAALRPPLARAQVPARRPSTARARAPPRA